LVAEGRAELEKLKAKFVAESAKRIGKVVTTHLKGEMSQLKEDIKVARENNFGRKLYEAFASEFSVTYLNDKAETRKLLKAITDKDQQLAESKAKIAKAQQLIESKEREVRMIKESTQRTKIMEELTSTLNEEKAEVMKSLLESVQTPKLKQAFDKYLPAVLTTGTTQQKTTKTVVTESLVEVTGNKSAKKDVVDTQERDNVIDIKRLAGL
jgi:septum formation inhibitor MinC